MKKFDWKCLECEENETAMWFKSLLADMGIMVEPKQSSKEEQVWTLVCAWTLKETVVVAFLVEQECALKAF